MIERLRMSAALWRRLAATALVLELIGVFIFVVVAAATKVMNAGLALLFGAAAFLFTALSYGLIFMISNMSEGMAEVIGHLSTLTSPPGSGPAPRPVAARRAVEAAAQPGGGEWAVPAPWLTGGEGAAAAEAGLGRLPEAGLPPEPAGIPRYRDVSRPGTSHRVCELGAVLYDVPAGGQAVASLAPGTPVWESSRQGNNVKVTSAEGHTGWLHRHELSTSPNEVMPGAPPAQAGWPAAAEADLAAPLADEVQRMRQVALARGYEALVTPVSPTEAIVESGVGRFRVTIGDEGQLRVAGA